MWLWMRPQKRDTPRRDAQHTHWAVSAAFCSHVFNKINAVTPAGTEGSVATKEMLKLQTAQLDEFFVRLKAKHDKPEKEDRGYGR